MYIKLLGAPLKGKFGPYAESVSAVWFWNKLKLRGGSRGSGEERLAYFKGGFIVWLNVYQKNAVIWWGVIVKYKSFKCKEK